MPRHGQQFRPERVGLRRREDRHRDNIVHFVHEAILLVSPEGVISGWDGTAHEVFGYRRGEIIGQPLHALIPPEARGKWGRCEQAALSEGAHCDHEARWLTKSHREVSVLVSVIAIKEPGGKLEGFTVLVRKA